MFKTEVHKDKSLLRQYLMAFVERFRVLVVPTLLTSHLGKTHFTEDTIAKVRVTGGVIWCPPDVVGNQGILSYQNLHVDNTADDIYNVLIALRDGYSIEFLIGKKR